MKISVIIPTYNEKKVLEDCIQSLGDQTLADFQIIIVDDGSTDGTLKILENLKKTLSDFTFFSQDHSGPGAARNLGAKHATGGVLVFVDADMTFDKNFLKKLTEPIINGEGEGTWSREEFVSNWDNVWSRCWNINEGWEKGRRHSKKHPKTQKVFRAIKKTEFDKVGGFDPSMGYTDDWTLSEKLKYEAIEADDAIFYHKNPDSLSEIFQHSKWVGKRPYKFGNVGRTYALLRASLPESIWAGFWKSLFNKEPLFIVFKVVYDLGIFIGILEQIISGKVSK